MFCNTPQVNQLTALLLQHGICDIVVCPGSRNATIVHNLHEAGQPFELHPVTDERSAGFVALGITLATQQPAAVCVTSGSALLGCIPAVAEAYYRHLPLLVISADRPSHWIGQLDGQTLPQEGALTPYCKTYQLCIPQTDEDRWFNNRCLNEALLTLNRNEGGPVHINVPIAEPMFNFTTEKLPEERVIREYRPTLSQPLPQEVIDDIAAARLPALVMGQYERGDLRNEVEELDRNGQLLILPEIISDVAGSLRMNVLDALDAEQDELIPDLIIQVGGNFVHKRFKQLFRNRNCRVIRIGCDREIPDTFCHLDTLLPVSAQPALEQLAAQLPHGHRGVEKARTAYERQVEAQRQTVPDKGLNMAYCLYSLKRQLEQAGTFYTLHLANSTSVRAAGRIFESGKNPIFCNRGVNGIEGSLSTAVGYSLKLWGLNIAVIGDLSFFYDANALWNTHLPADLRILLFNNGHGSIFDKLPGLSASPARDELIAAGHQSYSAEGIAETFKLGYHGVHHTDELERQMHEWLQNAETAQILEIFTKD